MVAARYAEAQPSIVVDAARFPLVYIGYPSAFSDEQWDAQLVGPLDRLLDRQVPFGWINDARTKHFPNAAQRFALARHQQRRASDYRRLVRGVATISDTALVRAIIVAIGWIHPVPFPHATFSDEAGARAYVLNKLAGDGR